MPFYHDTLDQIDREHGILWQFQTARYTVAFWTEPEDLDPADSFCNERDIAFASTGDPEHWFCAFVGIFDEDGERVADDCLGGCSYTSFQEFYSGHRWRYSRRQRKFITDPKSRAWKAVNARQPRRSDGSREIGSYFLDMVRNVCREARAKEIMLQFVPAA